MPKSVFQHGILIIYVINIANFDYILNRKFRTLLNPTTHVTTLVLTETDVTRLN